MGKGGWAGMITAELMGRILCGSVVLPRAPGYVEPLQGPRQPSRGDGLRLRSTGPPGTGSGEHAACVMGASSPCHVTEEIVALGLPRGVGADAAIPSEKGGPCSTGGRGSI